MKPRLLIPTHLFILLLLVISACGVKRMPSPPKQLPLPVVRDLAVVISGNTALLTWTVPLKDKGHKDLNIVIYRSATGLSDIPCNDCPVIFERADTIVISNDKLGAGRPFAMTSKQNVSKGYVYKFKVTIKPLVGAESEDSNIAEFRY